MNCTPLLIYTDANGTRQTLKGKVTNWEYLSLDDLIKNIINNNPDIEDWARNYTSSPIAIENESDLKYVGGNETLTSLVSGIQNLNKNYNPIEGSLKDTIRRILKLCGEGKYPRILHVNTKEITVNGAKIKKIYYGPTTNTDLIVLTSNNTAEIYNVLLEYLILRTLSFNNTKKDKLFNLIFDIISLAENHNDLYKKELAKYKNFKNVVGTILNDSEFNNLFSNLLPVFQGKSYPNAMELIRATLKEIIFDEDLTTTNVNITDRNGKKITIEIDPVKKESAKRMIKNILTQNEDQDAIKITLPRNTFSNSTINNIRDKYTTLFDAILAGAKYAITLSKESVSMKNFLKNGKADTEKKIKIQTKNGLYVYAKIKDVVDLSFTSDLTDNFKETWSLQNGYTTKYYDLYVKGQDKFEIVFEVIKNNLDEVDDLVEDIASGNHTQDEIDNFINEFYNKCP